MKKLLLTLIVSLAFCGSMFAQESHWSDYNPNVYSSGDGIVAFVQIDGAFVEGTSNYTDLEVAAFVGDVCRGHKFMDYYPDDGDPHPIVEIFVKYDDNGEAVTFKLYDHSTGIEYVDCTSNIEIITGTDHDELYFDYDEAVILSFTSPAQEGYTLEIDPYTSAKDNYYLIASPVGAVSAQAVEGLMTPSYDFYSFDQTQELEWINHRDDAEFELQPGVGYLYANNTGTDLTFTGTPVHQAGEIVDVDLDFETGAEFAGWNLVGNPFAENEAYILCRPFYVMNGETSDLIPMEANGSIAPMTGAFVVAQEVGEYVTFATDLGGVNCDEVGEDDKLVLSLTKGRGLIDRAIVRFGQGRQLPKFQLNPNSTKVYIPMNGQDYAIVNSAKQGELPVNFKAENGTYTLSVSAEAMGVNYLHLVDNLTGADTDLLASSSYTFEASATDYASRFKLVFATGDADDTFAFNSNGSWIVSNEGNATVQVIDLNGRILSSETISGSASVSVNAAPGVYMIRLINGDNVKVQKIIVK